MTTPPQNPATPSPRYDTPGFPPPPNSVPAASTAPAPALAPQTPSTPTLFALLLLLTALAAFLRYWRIGYQSYWTDEAWTVSRIHDSFSAMLASLSTIVTGQGLLPPWYAALRWWCNLVESFTGLGATAFSPTSTLAFAALFGTLTSSPPCTILARQFTDPPWRALLVAACRRQSLPHLLFPRHQDVRPLLVLRRPEYGLFFPLADDATATSPMFPLLTFSLASPWLRCTLLVFVHPQPCN